MEENSDENEIKEFWQENPCGENLTGRNDNWEQHFYNYDRFRYATEGHILDELDEIDFNGKKVLEIGIGQAADSAQIAKRGAIWHGLDLTSAAIMRAELRFELESLKFGEIKMGTAISIPWTDDSFDIVYSHGVLHHIPEIGEVVKELRRVLKPNGKLIIMIYHKNSLNYFVSILLIRRLLFLPIYFLHKIGCSRLFSSRVIIGHLKNADQLGILSYLKADNFLHANTDGPANPYSKVYDKKTVESEFSPFRLINTRVHFLNTRHFPGLTLIPKFLLNKLESMWGWHLWAFLKNEK